MKIVVFVLLLLSGLSALTPTASDLQKYEQYQSLLNKEQDDMKSQKDVVVRKPENRIATEEKAKNTKPKEANIFKYDYEEIELKRFGDNFFSNKNQTDPYIIPSSSKYILGSGDILFVSTYETAKSKTYELKIDNNGNINIPNMGLLKVASLSLGEAKTVISDFIIKVMPNIKVIVDIIEYSTIQVVITGNVEVPGIYNISSFSSIKDALIAANGVIDVGSYRDIEVIRAGKKIHTFDLYKLIYENSASSDILLQNGDIVAVNFTKKNIHLDGKVKHPAIYELKEDETFSDLMNYSGGFSFDATQKSIKLTRYDKDKTLKTFILDNKEFFALKPKDGDKIEVFNNYEIKEKPYVFVHGKVIKENKNKYSYFEGMTIKQLFDVVKFESEIVYATQEEYINRQLNISKKDSTKKSLADKQKDEEEDENEEQEELLKKQNLNVQLDSKNGDQKIREALFVDKNNVKVIRNNDDEKRTFVLSIYDDFVLMPYDDVEFFNYFDTNPRKVATIEGEVYKGGTLFIDNDTTLFDLIKLAGGFTKRAFIKDIELVRHKVIDDKREKEVIKVDFNDSGYKNIKIEDGDEITVFAIPNWYDTKRVTLQGEVKFPGTYVISNGEKLSSVIQRAGGFTEFAFLQGAVFTRESIRNNQIEQLERSMQEIKRTLTIFNAMPANSRNARAPGGQESSIAALNDIIKDAKKYTPLGRISIKLTKDLEELEQSTYDLVLQDNDTLSIPSTIDTVTVYGEVFSPNTFIFDGSKSLGDYIEMASGLTSSADEDKIYIVRADGTSELVNRGWFSFSSSTIKKGDTIVVPLYIKELNGLEVADSVSRIFSSVALTLAALKSLELF